MICGDAEVDQFQYQFAGGIQADHDILWLDVAVHQARRMRRLQSSRNLPCEFHHLIDAQRSRIHQAAQIATGDVFHHQNQMAVFTLRHVFNFDDVRTILQATHGPGFIHKLANVLRVRGKLFVQTLNHVHRPQKTMLCEINSAESAAAYFGLDRIVAFDHCASRPDLSNAKRFNGVHRTGTLSNRVSESLFLLPSLFNPRPNHCRK